MKKLMLVVLLGLVMGSCSTDDDVPNVEYGLAPILSSEFPAFFEPGKSYDLNLTYQLPTTCHSFFGFDGGRENAESQEFFVYALTSRDLSLTDCSSENVNLIQRGTIRNFMVSANVSEDEVFIFKLYKGNDSEDEPIFETIEVPVGETGLQPAN